MVLSSRVVLDSNILISALISAGRARRFIFYLVSQEIKIVLSDYIVLEVNQVLKRNKFKDKKIFEDIWRLIKRDVEIVQVNFKIRKTVLRDPKDQPILKTAQKAKAGFIITSDDDLLSLGNWKGIKIVTMRRFQEHF